MKSITLSFGIAVVFSVLAGSPATVLAGGGSDGPRTFAATQSSKHKQLNVCRARYRDCVSAKQIPSIECQYVYQDCVNHIV